MKPEKILLWPGDAPGSEGLELEPVIEQRSSDPAVSDRALSSIRDPHLLHWKPDSPNGCAILLAPGGGYQRIVMDKEGVDVAQWLCRLGVTVFVLNYRLPAEGHRQGESVALQDAQRALRLIRANASEYGLAPDRIGVLGFSAGGHVAAMLATCHTREVYAAIDDIDAISARPDFVMLGYPVISMAPDIAHVGSRTRLVGDDADAAHSKAWSADECVTAATPPCFIFLPHDDASVPSENSVRFYLALRHAGVSAEMHIFQSGGHGFGIRFAKAGTVRNWMLLCEAWLQENGALSQAGPVFLA